MAESSLVSVIIPAYNVEQYIENCISSVMKQSYANIEIIVVDDGSTDSTSKMIDEIRVRDSRVKVIHTKNRGVSSARNTGIEVARGEYITFVDADDYLADDFVEYLLGIMVSEKADFCISKNCFSRTGETQIQEDHPRAISKEEALVLLLSPQIIVGCWNKMYKKSMLTENNLFFQTELFYGEGLSFITTVAQVAERTVLCERRMYYYRRNNAASATSKFDIEKLTNGEKSLHEIWDCMRFHTRRADQMWKHHMSLFSLGAVVRMKTFHKEQEYPELYGHWKSYLNRNAFSFTFNKDLSLYRKVLLMSGVFCPGLLAWMDVKRRSNIAQKSV